MQINVRLYPANEILNDNHVNQLYQLKNQIYCQLAVSSSHLPKHAPIICRTHHAHNTFILISFSNICGKYGIVTGQCFQLIIIHTVLPLTVRYILYTGIIPDETNIAKVIQRYPSLSKQETWILQNHKAMYHIL